MASAVPVGADIRPDVTAVGRPASSPRREEGQDPRLERVTRHRSWSRLHIRDVAVAGLFLAIFAMALKPVVDNDVFWHLATGRYMWATRDIPHADPFSWTAPGRAWIAHEWLTETLLYPLYQHGGYALLALVFGVVITAAFAISYRTARLLGAARPIAAAITLLAAVASSHTWGVRPQMLSLLLSALTMWILARALGQRQHLTGSAGVSPAPGSAGCSPVPSPTRGRASSAVSATRSQSSQHLPHTDDNVWKQRRLLWLLPPLMVLWVNLHGGFIFGLAIIGLTAGGRAVNVAWQALTTPHPPAPSPSRGEEEQEGRRGHRPPYLPPLSRGRERRAGPAIPRVGIGGPVSHGVGGEGLGGEGFLWGIGALSIVACLLNPNGPKGLTYPFSYLGNNASTRYVAEWVRPDFHQLQYQFFGALLLLLVVGIVVARRRPRLADALLIVLFAYLGLSSVRNINLFSIVVAPFIAVFLSSAWRRVTDLRRRVPTPTTAPAPPPPARPALATTRRRAASSVPPVKAMLNALLVAVIAATVLVVSAPGIGQAHNLKVQAGRFPAGAVAYMQAHHPAGRLFNSYDWGGYLIWRLYPAVRVYVDGRPDMYGDSFMDAFIRTWRAQPGWQETLRRQHVGLVLVEPTSGLGRALATAAARRQGWRAIYHDSVAVLYERTS